MENFEIESTLKKLLGVEVGSVTGEIIDTGLSIAPFISKVITAYKINRLWKRLKEHEIMLNRIGDKVYRLDDPMKDMIQTTLFPYILDDLIEENQNQKVEFILNGLEYIVDEEIREESYIISFYDVLRDLRVDDIKRLLEYTIYFRINLENEVYQKRKTLERGTEAEQGLYYKEESYRLHIDNKLEAKGLIKSDEEDLTNSIIELVELQNKSMLTDDFRMRAEERFLKDRIKKSSDYYLTSFGDDFIKAFNLDIMLSELH